MSATSCITMNEKLLFEFSKYKSIIIHLFKPNIARYKEGWPHLNIYKC